MYNQVNRGSHYGQGSVPRAPMLPPPPPLQPGYQQAPPHFQQFVPTGVPPPQPPAPHVYLRGPPPPTASSTVPLNVPIQVSLNVMPNTVQSYSTPSQLHHGNSMALHSSNSVVQNHPIPPPAPPLSHSRQEISWAAGPPNRVLPPPPPSQGQVLYNPHICPPPPPSQPGDAQSIQHSHNTLPPPPAPGSGFVAAARPDGTDLHYQVSSITAPPLPSSPPPMPPSPPPLTPPVTSASSHAVRTDDPNSLKASGTELKARDSVVQSSDPNHDDGICVAGRDEVLPPPRSQPKEEKTVQKIEALCQLIAEKGADIEDKIRQDEFQNPEYAFLFGGVPGTEAAISHAYFLWMKKNYNFEPRWREKKSETNLGPFAIDSLGEQNHLHVATVNADSDMEMEDDITPSDKDQGSNQAIEALTQLHERVDDVFSINENIQQLQNSTENDPSKDILSFGSGLSSDLEQIKSARSVTKVHSTVNDSTEVAELPLGIVWDRSSAPLGDDFSRTGTSDLVKANNPDRDSVQLIRSGSPIRLLQDYASDDTSDNEDNGCGADANAFTVSAGANTDVSAAHKDSLCYLDPNIGSKSPYSFQKESVQLSKTYPYDSEISPYLVQGSKGIRKRSVSRWASDGHIEHNHENQVSVNIGSSTEAFQGKDGLGGAGIDNGSKSGNAEHEDEGKTSKVESNVLKLDKFGRQLRADLSESDSDDSRYHRNRRVNKRDRSWSRSRSPINRRRRRRSPRRRKDKRSQSRSRSPRHRRSRSRSPIRRHSGDFRGDNVKRDKGQCLDFFRGKCHRGASCRFIHHESDKNATSKNYRNKHNLEIYSHARSSRIIEDMKNTSSEVSNYERDGVRSHGVDHCQKVTGQEVVQRKEDSGRHAVVPSTFGPDVQLVNSNPSKSDDFREVATELLEARVVREETKSLIHEKDSFQKAESSHQQHFVDGSHPAALSSGDAFKLSGGAYKDITASEDSPFVQQIQSNVSVGIQENSGYRSQHINDSLMSDSSLDKRSIISASAINASGSEPLPYIMPSTQLQSANTSVGPCVTPEQPSSHSQTSKELPAHNDSSVELPHHTYQLPASVSHSQVENAVHIPQMSRQYGVMQQNTFTPFQSSNRENFEHYPAPFHTQNSHFSIPPNSSWTSLPPPPPPLSQAVYNSSLISGVSRSYTEFNQSQLHSRTDFVSHTSMKPGLPARSQSFEFQDQAYPLVQDLSRTFMPTEPFSPKHLPQGIPASQSFSGPNLSREDLHNQFSMQDSKFSSSTPFGGLHPQPKQFSWEPDVNKLPPSLDNKLLPEGHLKSSPDIHPLSQKQPSIHNFQCSAPDVNIGMPGESVTVSRYPPDVLDSNHSTSFNAFGGSRISAHYNPYASTFEKPLSSKFSSSMLRQEHDIIHGNNYGSSRLNHTPIHREDREDDGKAGSRQSASSPKAAGAVDQILPGSGGDQYDPLFDSIEPSSSSLKKFGFDQKQEVTGESNISLRPKSSYMFMDVEEKNKHEEIGVASTTSQNDEYGETADAEVGVVENESLSNHVDVANMTAGEDEINHIKSPGRRKKSKDSRSMKLFKISIANFVKEVLKPSWRQGNMSKVAFKTIVKKTVDKVSGAMKGHRVPKSQAKISQYIDSSQRKLTKLVMGYVDKYVKV